MSQIGNGIGVYSRGAFERATTTTTPGYFAGLQTTTSTSFNKGDLAQSFGMSVDPSAHKQLQLTDVMPDTKFAVPVVPPVDVLDVSQPVRDKPADPSAQIEEVNSARTQYMQANTACMNKICEAIVKADPEAAPGVIGKLMEPAVSGTATALSTALNVGTGMAAYEIINAMYKGLKGPSDAKVTEVLTKAISHLQNSNTPMVNNAPKTASPEEGRFNFAAIQSADQLKRFVTRNVNEDHVMKKLGVADQNLTQMAENRTNYKNHYHNTGDLEAKMVLAQEQGDAEMITKIASSQIVAEAVKAGAPVEKAEQAAHMPTEVGGMNNFLGGLLKANMSVTSLSMFSGATSTAMATKEKMGPILANEPDRDLTSAFQRPSMNV